MLSPPVLQAFTTLPAQRPRPESTAITDYAQTPLARITDRALMGALRDAAARGVRVRLLLDDFHTVGEDDLLPALASYPNVEGRLFNPFTLGRGGNFTRVAFAAFDFDRINRRMHNKLFIADNVAAVAGGPPDLVQMLDLPFDLRKQDIGQLPWAPARVLFDPLTKATGWNESHDSTRGTATAGVIARLHTARHDIKMVSPYFIPSQASAESLVKARREGLELLIITNSLASTDEPWVYGACSPYLKELLGAGVTIAELSPSLSVDRQRMGSSASAPAHCT